MTDNSSRRTAPPKCVLKRSWLFAEHVCRRLFWLFVDDYISKKKPLQIPLMQMWGWQQLCFLGRRPSCIVADGKSAFSQGWSSTMLRVSTSCALVVHFLTSRETTMGVTHNDGHIWHSDRDGQGKIQVSRFTATVTSWKASELQTDCSCCDFSFMRSGSGPGTFFFIFHGSKVVLSTFPCSFCNIKKKVSGKKWKREADCDFGVWGRDCNCLLAGTEMLFLDSLLQCQSRTLSLKEASWKTFYFLLSALFISFR